MRAGGVTPPVQIKSRPPQPGQSPGQSALQRPVEASSHKRTRDSQSSVLPRLLTMRQAGDYLAVSYWTVRSWVESGQIPAVRLPGGGKLLRIDRADLDALIERSRLN
jgi:excisionase family DNA binding protein